MTTNLTPSLESLQCVRKSLGNPCQIPGAIPEGCNSRSCDGQILKDEIQTFLILASSILNAFLFQEVVYSLVCLFKKNLSVQSKAMRYIFNIERKCILNRSILLSANVHQFMACLSGLIRPLNGLSGGQSDSTDSRKPMAKGLDGRKRIRQQHNKEGKERM